MLIAFGVLVSANAAAVFLAVRARGWPSVAFTFADPVTGADNAEEAEPVERVPAIGFAVPAPEDDWLAEESGSEIESRRRRARRSG